MNFFTTINPPFGHCNIPHCFFILLVIHLLCILLLRVYLIRLSLITHEMSGSCDGARARAGKHRFWYPGSCPTLHAASEPPPCFRSLSTTSTTTIARDAVVSWALFYILFFCSTYNHLQVFFSIITSIMMTRDASRWYVLFFSLFYFLLITNYR